MYKIVLHHTFYTYIHYDKILTFLVSYHDLSCHFLQFFYFPLQLFVMLYYGSCISNGQATPECHLRWKRDTELTIVVIKTVVCSVFICKSGISILQKFPLNHFFFGFNLYIYIYVCQLCTWRSTRQLKIKWLLGIYI